MIRKKSGMGEPREFTPKNIADYKPCEGPFALVAGDTVHILYSGNRDTPNNYCVGYLTFTGSIGENLLNAQCRKKSPNAFLTKRWKRRFRSAGNT